MGRLTVQEKKLALKKLGDDLEKLLLNLPETKNDLKLWYEQARSVEDNLTTGSGLSPEVPHFLWHYLADADIRLKDAEYAAMQNRRMRRLIGYLQQGVMPKDEDVEDR